MDEPTNDNNAARAWSEPDAQGQAAMLMIESLMHGLIARSLISVHDAVEIIGIAVDAALEVEQESTFLSGRRQSSRTILEAISRSLSRDL